MAFHFMDEISGLQASKVSNVNDATCTPSSEQQPNGTRLEETIGPSLTCSGIDNLFETRARKSATLASIYARRPAARLSRPTLSFAPSIATAHRSPLSRPRLDLSTLGSLQDQNTVRKYSGRKSLDNAPSDARTKRRSVLSVLSELLTGYQSKPQSPEPDTKTESIGNDSPPVTAQLQPTIRRVVIRESPSERWEQRGRLSIHRWRKRNEHASFDPDQQGYVYFEQRHKAALAPPARPDYVDEDEIGRTIMHSSLQVLTTPTSDTQGTTLLLRFPSKRYVFGSLAEGTQRAAVQIGARFLKVQEFFVTGRTEWSNVGGLVGVVLTLADSSSASQASAIETALEKMRSKAKRLGDLEDEDKMQELERDIRKVTQTRITFFGPPNLNHMLATTRRYVFRKGMPVDIHEIRDSRSVRPPTSDDEQWKPTWSDECIKVWSMSISPTAEREAKATTSMSPRKRSLDEVAAEDAELDRAQGKQVLQADDLSPKDRDYLTVKAVVNEMFNSSWRLDTLHKTPLSEVKLPATVFMRDPETHGIVKYQGPLPDGKQTLPNPNLEVLVRLPWPGALVESLPHTAPAKEAISYIVKNHPQRGKFDVKRAKELKLTPGPDYSKLAAGQSVVNQDGETITPDMVLGETKEGSGIAVVDLPNPEYIDSLTSRPEWLQPKVMLGVGAIFWICGKGVATDPRLHAFMTKFKHLEHIVSSPDYCPDSIALESTATSTVRLRKIDPDRFGVPVHDSATSDGAQPYGGNGHAIAKSRDRPLPPGVRIAARGDVLSLEPSLKYDTSAATPAFDVGQAESAVPPEAIEEAAKARLAIDAPDSTMQAWLDTLPPGAKDVEIITLGTGSALPSKYRNVSSTMVRVPNWGNILLDCGENTLGQLKRVFGEKEFSQVMQELRMLTISHMHADHHLGTTAVIKAWYQEVHGGEPGSTWSPADTTSEVDLERLIRGQRRLAVISEPAMQAWLYEYSFVEDYGYSRLAPLVLPTTGFSANQSKQSPNMHWFTLPQVMSRFSKEEYAAREKQTSVAPGLLELAEIRAVNVAHCHGARAISITLPSGFKVSFSGDCRPSAAFAAIGQGSTVCIHEATFDDELRGDAIAKKHSTTSEALGVAESMRARACVLTHFSQRYQKVPILERSSDASEAETSAAIGEGPSTENDDDVAMLNNDDGNEPELEGHTGGVEEMTYAAQNGSATRTDGEQYDLPDSRMTPSAGATETVTLRLKSDMQVCVAFDYMRVKVGDIGHLEKFTPALLKLFTEEVKEESAAATASADAGQNGHVEDAKKDKKKNKKNGGQRRN